MYAHKLESFLKNRKYNMNFSDEAFVKKVEKLIKEVKSLVDLKKPLLHNVIDMSEIGEDRKSWIMQMILKEIAGREFGLEPIDEYKDHKAQDCYSDDDRKNFTKDLDDLKHPSHQPKSKLNYSNTPSYY